MALPAATIYIIDDDLEVGRALARLMRSVGYCPVVFQTALAFLSAHDRALHGCILLDARLPELGGLQLQAILRASGSLRPIVFLSGVGTIEMTVEAVKAGAIDFLTKPIDSQSLLKAVEQALRIDAERQGARREKDTLRGRLVTLTPRERKCSSTCSGAV